MHIASKEVGTVTRNLGQDRYSFGGPDQIEWENLFGGTATNDANQLRALNKLSHTELIEVLTSYLSPAGKEISPAYECIHYLFAGLIDQARRDSLTGRDLLARVDDLLADIDTASRPMSAAMFVRDALMLLLTQGWI